MSLGSNLFYKFIFIIVDLLLLDGGKYKLSKASSTPGN